MEQTFFSLAPKYHIIHTISQFKSRFRVWKGRGWGCCWSVTTNVNPANFSDKHLLHVLNILRFNPGLIAMKIVHRSSIIFHLSMKNFSTVLLDNVSLHPHHHGLFLFYFFFCQFIVIDPSTNSLFLKIGKSNISWGWDFVTYVENEWVETRKK